MTTPTPPEPGQVTQLLALVERGDDGALDRLLPLLYRELHRLAEQVLQRERPGHTLQPTALINEAYLRLAGADGIPASSRQHFLRIAARAMRQVLVDHARRRAAARRGGGARAVTFEDALPDASQNPEELLALDQALEWLGTEHPRLRSVVALRWFAGLTAQEIADTLGVTTRTVPRAWLRARALLDRELYPSQEPPKA